MRLILISLSLILFLSGCGKEGSADKKEILAYVNKEPVFDYELRRDIALRAKYDPAFKVAPDTESDQLDVIINRKLIIQSAMEKGLAREERFVNTIRTFWEQVLIRDFIDYKKKEFQEYLFATDDDIKRYYNNMSHKVTFKLLKSKDSKRIDEAEQKYLTDKDTSIWQVVGPMSYDDAASSVLLDAFEMDKGEAKKFYDQSNYYLIEIAEKEKLELEPLENIKSEVEKRVIAMKEKRLFEDWLKEKRKKANVRVTR